MSTTLLQRFLGSILLLMLLVLGARPAQASHLLGGEMNYRYLDANGPAGAPFRYEITVTLYSNGLYPTDPSVAQYPNNVTIELYNQTNGARITAVSAPRQGVFNPQPIRPSVPQGCTVVGPNQPFYLLKYVQTVNLPVSFDGYYAVFSLAARNYTLSNLNAPASNGQPLTLYVSMAPPLIPNRSPVFSDTAVAIVCQNDTTITLNNAFDADGDRLVYSFGSPYGQRTTTATFPPLPQAVPYFSGYSATNPFGQGAGNFATINASTGVAKYGAKTNGLYVIAVDVSEYRTINGREVLIGTTRRDLQLVVSTCPPTPPPVLPPTLTTPRNYTIEEGQSLSIPITATQASNHPLVLTVNSALLDGNGPFNTTFNGSTGTVQPGNLTGTATASGTGSVSGTFVFNSACGTARATAYDLGVTVKDNGCGGRLASDIFRITVTRAAGPNAINGPTTVCDPATVRTYTASGPVPASYKWRAVGGTITGGQGTSAVQVVWGNANTTGTLVLKGLSAQGCPTDSVVKTVDIRPLAPLTVTASAASICLGSSTTLTVNGPAGLTYAWSGGGQTSTSTSLTVAPTATTTYTVVGTDGTCTISATSTVTVTPPPTALTGADRSVCSGTTTVLGAPAQPGYTYSWSPATGLSSATVAQPTVTLTNTTGAPIIQTYVLTVVSGASCSSVGSVRVTVNPEAIANAGPARAACAGQPTTLGAPAQAGYTYSWSPATGLSSSTVAQPVLRGVNTTALPLTVTYTLTATSAEGCVKTDAVTVTVNPRPAAEGIVGPVSVCPTVTGIAYSVPTPAATAYTWLVSGGTIASGQGTPAVTVDWGGASSGAYLKVFRLNAQGCSSDTTTLPVIINPRLQTVRPTGPGDILAAAPLPRAVCQADGPFTYSSGVFANGSSYSWQIIGGTQVSTAQNTVTVNWAPVSVPTIGKIVATETSNPAGGICRGVSDTLKVLINPSPRTLAIVSPVRVCQNSGPVTFSVPGGFTGSTYVFQLSGVALAGTGSSRVLNTLPAPGTYSLTVQETTASGCVGPLLTTPFTVNPLPVAPTISGSAFVCNTATPQQYTIANPTTGASFQWTVVGGTITAGGNSSQVTVFFNATGPYSVSAVETSASPASCAGPAATRTITFDNPGLTLTAASVDATSNNRVILTFTSPNSTNTPNPVRILRRVAGSGTFAQVGTVASSAITYTDNTALDASANSYEYQLSLTNGCGTPVLSTVAQTIRLVASNSATPGTGGRNQGSTALTWNAYVGFPVTEYRIYRRADAGAPVLLTTVPGSTLQATVPNADAGSVTGAGFTQNFRVVAVSPGSILSNSNEASVNFANALQTYNIITPNRDGQNDVLVIDNIQLYPGNTFTVFNRWGREVYSTTNYQNNWGGDANTAAGTYFYLLKLPNGSSLKNWFEVVK
ncbi:gliding motility-associated C-terminal domain-containing protein [Hymenobacter sp. BT770]|uniref:T9SS type B sorting domain-containing protein n=1 Tax=Hymenobacter sp. BT770 TaxID=2886942 RepID=UPI001D12C511|nr:gliding motility-associated C-terminal domain-containing protein [Hymenobacter sp. BT770]MCC3153095.1 gliding motility-associated C-terminal domain-containing protein [Hymenobacter sp. BT770]MDO3415431.1 gliding motility-associated C-terminal domain-containing protein [Hymenobacter sp. BT770]